ncbi:hypothetical protein RL73_02630 [Liberibacter crescens]|nr:hypothetical protein RL73_02630 [Liberibacter crescens]
MREEEKIAMARDLLAHPLFNSFFEDLETSAVDRCLHAAWLDHEGRAQAAAEARGIRSFHAYLEKLAKKA